MIRTLEPSSPSKVRIFLEAIRVEHTLFALPFAYLGMILGAGGLPTVGQFLAITLAMASARTFAMSLNRLIDRHIDARNPRTAGRALPRGLLSPREMVIAAFSSAVVLALAAVSLNTLCLVLMPGAVVVLTFYSYTKRFTWFCHLFLGVAIGLAPVGAWVGVTGAIALPPLVLFGAVTFWLAGFDIIYACQDIDIDRRDGLFSVPARFGLDRGLQIARGAHVVTVLLFGSLGIVAGLGPIYAIGVVGAGALLTYEHVIVSPRDLTRLNIAFFNVNAYLSIWLFAMTAADLALTWYLG